MKNRKHRKVDKSLKKQQDKIRKDWERSIDKLRSPEVFERERKKAYKIGSVDPQHPWRARNQALPGTQVRGAPGPVRVLVKDGLPQCAEGADLLDKTSL